ncbi:MAG: PAS domain-containing protein, partial [Nitrospiraceae bacterium]
MKNTAREIELEVENLRARLIEAEETLQAIQDGAVDALVVSGQDGPRVYTLQGADHPYRIMVEEMNEGAVTTTADGVILYSNHRLAELSGIAVKQLLGTSIRALVS